MDLEYQEKLIEYKINELNILISNYINYIKVNNKKEKRKIYNKNYYNNKINKKY